MSYTVDIDHDAENLARDARLYIDQDGATLHSEIEADRAFILSCRQILQSEGVLDNLSDELILSYLPRVEAGAGWSDFSRGITLVCSEFGVDVREHVAWMVMLPNWKRLATPIRGALDGIRAWRALGAQTVMVTGSERLFIDEFLGDDSVGYDAYFTRTTPNAPKKPSAALANFIETTLNLPERSVRLFYGDSSSDISQGTFLGAIPIICPHHLSIKGVENSPLNHIRLNSPAEFTPHNSELRSAIRDFVF